MGSHTKLLATAYKDSLIIKYGGSFKKWLVGADSQYDFAHLVTDSTDSDECWKLASQWVKNCDSKHDCTKDIPYGLLPTRLVKINTVVGRLSPCLIESASLPTRVKYCTLSHCWGDVKFLKLVQHNFDSFTKSIPYDLLSQTFKDAIYAAHKMGFEYIWIDSLCIIQEDDYDWSKEACTMSSVYAGSGLNLAATSAKDGQDGLFRSRAPAAVLPCLIKLLGTTASEFLIFNEDLWGEETEGLTTTSELLIFNAALWGEEIEGSVPSSRAWVLQERVLAVRTLHFASDQLFWECTAGTACESCPWDPASAQNYLLRGLHGVRKLELLEAWETAVKHYSTAKLSFESDKYVAFAGVAKYLSEKGLGTYIAGLWQHDLESQLLWKPAHLGGTRPIHYRGPSWSWMALDGVAISIGKADSEDKLKDFIQVVGLCIMPKIPGDVFGEITSASLSLRCTRLKKFTATENFDSGKYEVIVSNPEDNKASIKMCLDIVEQKKRMPRKIFLLRVFGVNLDDRSYYTRGLLLQRSQEGVNTYQRIGAFYENSWDSDEDGEEESDFWWASLEDAEMGVRAPQEAGTENATDEEQFIITLV